MLDREIYIRVRVEMAMNQGNPNLFGDLLLICFMWWYEVGRSCRPKGATDSDSKSTESFIHSFIHSFTHLAGSWTWRATFRGPTDHEVHSPKPQTVQQIQGDPNAQKEQQWAPVKDLDDFPCAEPC